MPLLERDGAPHSLVAVVALGAEQKLRLSGSSATLRAVARQLCAAMNTHAVSELRARAG